jgi:hypothetical protein
VTHRLSEVAEDVSSHLTDLHTFGARQLECQEVTFIDRSESPRSLTRTRHFCEKMDNGFDGSLLNLKTNPQILPT